MSSELKFEYDWLVCPVCKAYRKVEDLVFTVIKTSGDYSTYVAIHSINWCCKGCVK